jgi:hypothetical protein
MSADYTTQVHTLLEMAGQLPSSSTQMNTLEEAVRLADVHGDVDLGLEARRRLMRTARAILRADVLTTAFTWCLGQYDREPRRFAGRDLFREYGWVIGQLANLPDVARPKLEELLADFARRLDAAGASRRAWHFVHMCIAPDLGDRDLGGEAVRALRRHPRDRFCHDALWELAEEVEVEAFRGQWQRALHLAEPFLKDRYYERGKSDSACANLLLFLLKEGRRAEADALHTRCLRSYTPGKCYYWWFGELLKFAAFTNDLGRAVRWYEECQRAITRHTDPLTRLHLALDAVVVFDRLIAAGTEKIALRLSDVVPVSPEGNLYRVTALREWLGQEAAELADRFDARNGNSYFREQLQQRAEMKDWKVDAYS